MAERPAFPLDAAEAIVIDGANSVTGASRTGFPDWAGSLALTVVAAAVVVTLRRTRFRRPALAAVLLGAAVSGWWALLVERGDTPLRQHVGAALVTTSLDDLARQGQQVEVVRDDGDVLFPLARYVWPARRAVDGGVKLELRGGSLISACHPNAVSGHVVCGTGP